jgi:hypothetical protein
MLHPTNNIASDLHPVDTSIQLLIDQSYQYDVVASDQIKAMRDLARRFRVIVRSDNTFKRLRENLFPISSDPTCPKQIRRRLIDLAIGVRNCRAERTKLVI